MTKNRLTPIIILLSLMLSGTIIANEMTGMYSYMADTGLFLKCGQTKRLPVAMEGDNAALERAYLKNRYQPGKSLLVTIKGHTSTRPKMEGDGRETVLIVDEFLSIAQQERCTGIVPPSSLINTYWKLVELDGKKINHHAIRAELQAQRELYFIIKKDNVVSGFSGCNKFSGNLTSDDKKIKIGPLMMTRMACPAMEIEHQFNTRLTKADNYHIKGESLELFQGNKLVAKFIAMYF